MTAMNTYLRERLADRAFILRASTIALIALILGGCLYFREVLYRDENARVNREAELAVDAFEQHTAQIVNQVDMLLLGVRMMYQRSASAAETERFIRGVNFNTSVIEDVFVAARDGSFIIPFDDASRRSTVADRDYFVFHSTNVEDRIFISPVEKGRISGKYRFRISRRVFNPDGTFGGVVLGTVKPESFTHYFQELKIGPQNVATLAGTLDRKLRARIPEPRS